MLKRHPLVSVCIPTYNRAGLLGEAIESALSQTFTDFELIISDNASQDATGLVVNGYRDSRIHYIKNARNVGHRENWNQCLRLARGEYITILPDDDLMMPDNLELKVGVMATNPSVGLVHSKYHLIDADGKIIKYNTNEGHRDERTKDAHENGQEVLATMLSSSNIINAPTVLFRTECYERLGGFTDRLCLAFDWEYWMRIAVHYDVGFLAKPLIKWRIHRDSLTAENIHLKKDTLTIRALREELAAKRLILKNHGYALAEEVALKKRVKSERISRIVSRAEWMLGDGGPNSEVKRFVLEMATVFPEIIFAKQVWKVFLKSVLPRNSIELLKRVSPV